MKTILVTGSSGLIGSEAVEHFDHQGHQVIGVDNNMRSVFFNDPGDTTWNLERLRSVTRNFTHFNLDIRNRSALTLGTPSTAIWILLTTIDRVLGICGSLKE